MLLSFSALALRGSVSRTWFPLFSQLLVMSVERFLLLGSALGFLAYATIPLSSA